MPLDDGLVLAIDDASRTQDGYPTDRLQKGLVVLDGGESLAGEGVGFGVPVLKQGVRTIFAGAAHLESRRRGRLWEVDAVYSLCLVEGVARRTAGAPRLPALCALRDGLAAAHRHVHVLRKPLAVTSVTIRRVFGLRTVYEEVDPIAELPVTYRVDRSGRIAVRVDLTALRCDRATEVVVMDELGAGFDRYEDENDPVLKGGDIGTWDDVAASWARFTSDERRVSFAVGQADGAKLRRGRELVGSRLAWSGFGHCARPAGQVLAYDVTVARLS
jgi:hypothetical protein